MTAIRTIFFICLFSASIVLTGCGRAPEDRAVPENALLPDLVVDEEWLHEYFIAGSDLRLSNGTANMGPGVLHVFGGEEHSDGRREVWQRIFRSDGTHEDRLAASYHYHREHGHIHVENWAVYRLRKLLPDGGVGEIVAESAKPSYCLNDLAIKSTTVPNFDPKGRYFTCTSRTQGLSVGWLDVYSAGLPGQIIPIDGVEDGEYWLESVVDPDNQFVEANESNNTARIRIRLGSIHGKLPPDRFEPNDSHTRTSSRTAGAINSPNLGPTGPETTLDKLTIHTTQDQDYFRFYMPAQGSDKDFVQIRFDAEESDLRLRLFTDAGNLLASSKGDNPQPGIERISLSRRSAGWYVVQVHGFEGSVSSNYSLTLNPSANGPPSITVTAPPAGDTRLRHGAENYLLTWEAADPESNSTWVTWYANHSPSLDGRETLIPTSNNLPGAQGKFVLNSAYLKQGSYWFYASVTDGGSVSGAWSDGSLTFGHFCTGDLTGDGRLNREDEAAFKAAYLEGKRVADLNGDGELTPGDREALDRAMATGCDHAGNGHTHPPAAATQ